MRFAIVLVLGLFIGVMATVMTLGALRQGTPFHQGLMAVMAWHHGQLRGMADPERCDIEAAPRHLAMLAQAGEDLESAFLPTFNDERFIHYARGYRQAVAAARGEAPADCAAVAAIGESLRDSCSACHRDFR